MFTKTTESLLNYQVPVEIVFTETKTELYPHRDICKKLLMSGTIVLWILLSSALTKSVASNDLSARNSTFGFKNKIKLAHTLRMKTSQNQGENVGGTVVNTTTKTAKATAHAWQ